MKRTDEFWSDSKHDEQLYHMSVGEAMSAIVDSYFFLHGKQVHPLPRKIELHRWVRVEAKDGVYLTAEEVMEWLADTLQEEYGPHDEPLEFDDLIEKSASGFAAVVNALFVPWQCDVVDSTWVDVGEYLASTSWDEERLSGIEWVGE